MTKTRRKNARVKLPIRQAHELEATLYNVKHFCGMCGASEELMAHIRSCEQNVTRAVEDRNRVVGIPKTVAARSAPPSDGGRDVS